MSQPPCIQPRSAAVSAALLQRAGRPFESDRGYSPSGKPRGIFGRNGLVKAEFADQRMHDRRPLRVASAVIVVLGLNLLTAIRRKLVRQIMRSWCSGFCTYGHEP